MRRRSFLLAGAATVTSLALADTKSAHAQTQALDTVVIDQPPSSSDARYSIPITSDDSSGPYYPLSFLDDDRMDLTRVHPGLWMKPEGRPFVLRGRLLDSRGNGADGAIMEFWQANAAGFTRRADNSDDPNADPWFEGNARCFTPKDGSFTLRSVRPGSTQTLEKGLVRAPHLTLTIFSNGFNRLVTQIYFNDAPENKNDPLLMSLPKQDQARLLAQRTEEVEDGAQVYTLELSLSGDNEAPFFDDLLS